MRVIFFIGQLKIGGAEQQLVNLATGLNNLGCSVNVVTIFSGGENAKKLEKISGLQLNYLWAKKGGNVFVKFFQLFLTPALLYKIVNSSKPDCIYSMLYLTNLIAWFASRGRYSKTLIWGVRSSNMILNWKRSVPERVCAFLSSSVPLVIANSFSGMRFHKKRGYAPKSFKVINNGIDTDEFKFNEGMRLKIRRELKVSSSCFLVGIVARLDPMKDHSTFLNAAALVVKKHRDVKFICVGGGEKAYTDELHALADDLGLIDCIIWLGNRNDIVSIYSAIDLLVSSSSGEGFPNVIGEAMSCGVSCVVTDVGDSAKIVGDIGFVIEPKKPKVLSLAICNVFTSEDRNGRSIMNRLRIVNHFSQNKLIENTKQVLNEFSNAV